MGIDEPIFETYEDPVNKCYRTWIKGLGTVLTHEDEKRILAMFDDLKLENIKLRELCKQLYVCAEHGYCGTCKYVSDTCDFRHDMQELGIEV